MVNMTKDFSGINPLERMDMLEDITKEKKTSIAQKKKELEELEKKKKQEIEELDAKKKRELDDLEKKKKELHEFEKKKAKEIEDTAEMIEESFQELMRHKKLLLEEEEKKTGIAKTKNKETLEEAAEMAPKKDFANVNYSKFFEQLQPPTRLYQVANTGFYNNLSELRNKAALGTITPQEEAFVEQLKDRFETFQRDNSYIKNNDQNQYVNRSLQVIGQIQQYNRLKID